nr:unnamed protein product [Digitaria exilis]
MIQKKQLSHLLLDKFVTGIKKASEEYKVKGTCTSTNILLCVTGPWADVKISMLSDNDIEEDECSALNSSVKEGLLERATIAEFEEKVATVHTDMVNHWIERELVRLERHINRAQNKGLHVEYPFQTDNHLKDSVDLKRFQKSFQKQNTMKRKLNWKLQQATLPKRVEVQILEILVS